MSSREALLERVLDTLSRVEGIEADLAARRERRLLGDEPTYWQAPQAEEAEQSETEEAIAHVDAALAAVLQEAFGAERKQTEDEIAALRQEVDALRSELRDDIASVREEIAELREQIADLSGERGIPHAA